MMSPEGAELTVTVDGFNPEIRYGGRINFAGHMAGYDDVAVGLFQWERMASEMAVRAARKYAKVYCEERGTTFEAVMKEHQEKMKGALR